MLLSTMILQAAAGAALGKAGAALGAAIAAIAAAFGIGNIGKAALEAGARQPEKAESFRMTAIIHRRPRGRCLPVRHPRLPDR